MYFSTRYINANSVTQSTAQAMADARKAADYMNATAPGSPAAQQATRAYLETKRLASMAQATHDPNIARQAVQASQASVNYTNNVATGRSPNTYSPYDSNGNATSYYNSSYQTGKIPSPDAPRIEELNEQQAYYCSIADRVPNTNALGAGDYGSSRLSIDGIRDAGKVAFEGIKYFLKSVELSVGIGQGIGATLKAAMGEDSIKASLQYSSNYFEIGVDDGKWSLGRSITAAAIIEIFSGKLGIERKETDSFDQNWILDEESSFTFGSIPTSIGIDSSWYFIMGESFDFSLNILDLVKHYPEFAEKVREIINEE